MSDESSGGPRLARDTHADGETVLHVSLPSPDGLVATVRVRRAGSTFEQDVRALARQLAELATAASGSAPPAAPLEGVAEIAASFVEEALHALDDMAGARVQERLRYVAETASERFGCAGWWLATVTGDLVSPREHGARDVATLRRLQATAERARPLRTPAVRAALEGGSLHATDQEPALGERLREAGMTEVVAVGGYDTDAVQWLVCLGADGGGEALRATRSALFAAVQAALGFPRGPRPGAR